MTGQLAPLFTWRSALCESDLSPVARHVALTLSLYMNERGGSAHPGAARIARDTGLHVSTVRERLAELVDGGWLVMLEQGGQRGVRKCANVYEARLPPDGLSDPSPTPTHRPGGGDPSPSPRSPLAHGDPISSGSLQEIPPGGADALPTDDSQSRSPVVDLVAGYVAEYRVTHNGQPPIQPWRDQAGRHAKELLAADVDPAAIAACFNAIARENKAPNALPHVLADYHAQVPT